MSKPCSFEMGTGSSFLDDDALDKSDEVIVTTVAHLDLVSNQGSHGCKPSALSTEQLPGYA